MLWASLVTHALTIAHNRAILESHASLPVVVRRVTNTFLLELITAHRLHLVPALFIHGGLVVELS